MSQFSSAFFENDSCNNQQIVKIFSTIMNKVVLKLNLVLGTLLGVGCGNSSKSIELGSVFVICYESSGRSAEEVERDIIVPVESIFERKSGIKSITSSSSSSNAQINLEFSPGKDITKRQNEIETVLSQSHSKLPKDTPHPVVTHVAIEANSNVCE